ncbi:WAT1-related protein At1g44800 isoform X2 [Amborella trichopoda]|uniref:WAT1-related protein At1g44800 isoform X2 n=1 Tax=Amborella trichopoda TaxID=13333 RepID=UPI0009BE9534|nr:WAT1-related protein At1g44800 isoform X2 [Amborella trichopoda]|eukprot:XP_020530742.1 WAT1-related protein At1g44800 isoform X2 [Amborella trichopoda]
MEVYVPVLAQFLVQLCIAVMYLMTKGAFAGGMSPFVFITYRTIIATVFLAPFAFIAERETRPPLTIKIASQIFILGFLGIGITQNCYFSSLYLTSSTFVSTLSNLIPATTFLMALLLRLEKFDIISMRGKAKFLGIVICVGGAMIMTLVRGPTIRLLRNLELDESPVYLLGEVSSNPSTNWTLGSIIIFLSILAWSAWLNYQAWAFKNYPAPLSLTALMCFMGIFPSALIAVLVEDSTAWRLKWDIRLFIYIYSGVFCTAFQFYVQSWCIKIKGPLFPAAFYPICTLIVSIMEPAVFHVSVHVGSAVGMVTVIAGLYCVLWGKAKQEKVRGLSPKENEASHVTMNEPLLAS